MTVRQRYSGSMRQRIHYRACEYSSTFGKQQSHSHGSLFGSEGQENSWEHPQSPADPRCSYLPLSVQLPSLVSFLIHYLYLSPQCGKGKKNLAKLCSSCEMVVFANYFSPCPPLLPDVANLV